MKLRHQHKLKKSANLKHDEGIQRQWVANISNVDCSNTYIHIYEHTYIYTYIRIYIQTYLHTYKYDYTYIHIYIYIHMNIPT